MVCKILSLDGGGPWAMIQACVLQDLYPDWPGRRILAEFDLAIANSGGGITLAGLLKNLTPAAIRDLFLVQANREKIFVRRNWAVYEICRLLGVGPKWDAAAKLQGLRTLFNAPLAPGGSPDPIGDVTLDALPDLPDRLQVIIAAFDYDQNREVFFRRKPSVLQGQTPPFTPSLAGAVHASSNAPINYFNAPALLPVHGGVASRRFWDGGVGGFNNPVLRGVIEVLANDRTLDPSDISALSLGTGGNWQPAGTAPSPAEKLLFAPPCAPGPRTDLLKMATAIIDDPPDAASVDAHVITRAPDDAPRIIRLSPVIGPERQGTHWGLPAGFSYFPGITPAVAFTTLLNMPMDAVAQQQVDLIQTLAAEWIAGRIPNQPILRNQEDGSIIIGHGRYADGKNAW